MPESWGRIAPSPGEEPGRCSESCGGVADEDDGDGVGATSARTTARVRARAGRRLQGRGIGGDLRRREGFFYAAADLGEGGASDDGVVDVGAHCGGASRLRAG